jgi:hypothetical protein
MTLHNPVLKVTPHGIIKVSELLIHATDAANQRHQCGQFAGRLLALVVVQLALGLPNMQGAEFGFIGFENVHDFVNHCVNQFTAALWVVIKNTQGVTASPLPTLKNK